MPILLSEKNVAPAIDERPAPRNGGRPGIEFGPDCN